jgi:hypothetical protein
MTDNDKTFDEVMAEADAALKKARARLDELGAGASSHGSNSDAGDAGPTGYTFRPFVDQIAREHGAYMADCLALSVSNDPFNSGGTPGQMKLARWFRDIWIQLGRPQKAYIRGMHYRLGSWGTVRLPFGRFNGRKTGAPLHSIPEIERTEREHPEWKMYLYDDTCYDLLGEAANEARNTGLVPMGAVEDHRNPDPVIHADEAPPDGEAVATTPLYNEDTEDYDAPQFWGALPAAPERPTYRLRYYHGDDSAATIRRERSYYHLEIWCEKSDIQDAIESLCIIYGANFIAGMGELSIRAVQDFMERVDESGRPAARILYISDLDQNGIEMPKSIGAKIAWTIKHQAEREGRKDERDIGLHPIALTRRQMRDLGLPNISGKGYSDGAKIAQRNNFERMFGIEGKVELDALDATGDPDVLQDIVRDWLDRYQDATLPERIADARTEVSEALVPIQTAIHEAHDEEYQELLSAHQACLEAITPALEAYREKLLAFDETVRSDLEDALSEAQENLPEFPTAQSAPDEERDELFYSSHRDYWDQLQAYKMKLIEIHGLEGEHADAVLMTRTEKKRANRAERKVAS